MIYLEFIERDRTMALEIFRHLGNQGSDWAEGVKDRMILQLGRTLRLGPAPTYLCLWEISELGRLDTWDAYFHSPAASANSRSLAMHRAIHIQRAGLYEILDRAASLVAPLTLIEYVDPIDQPDAAIRAALADRARRHREMQPILVLQRLGRLGPDPALLVFWAASSHAETEALLRDAQIEGMRLVDVGLYRPFGQEIL